MKKYVSEWAHKKAVSAARRPGSKSPPPSPRRRAQAAKEEEGALAAGGSGRGDDRTGCAPEAVPAASPKLMTLDDLAKEGKDLDYLDSPPDFLSSDFVILGKVLEDIF